MAGIPLFKDLRCLNLRTGKETCARCLAACPTEAISPTGGLTINRDRCRGCLLCVAACPTEALQVGAGSLLRLLNPAEGEPPLVIGCAREGVAGQLVFPCLGGLPAEALLALLLLYPGLQVNATGCRDCPRGFILPALQKRLEQCREVIVPGENNNFKLVTDPRELVYKRRTYDRREFFRASRFLLLRGAVNLERNLRPPTPNKQPSPKVATEQRQLLNRAMSVIPEEKKKPILVTYYCDLSLRETCNYCFACSNTCPTGALEASMGSPPALLYHGAICIGCGICREVCHRDAVFLRRGGSWERLKNYRPLVPDLKEEGYGPALI